MLIGSSMPGNKRVPFRLLFFPFLLLCFNAFAQTAKVTLDLKDVKVSDALQAIEKQTGYLFNYKADVVDGNKPVSFSVKEAPVKEALDRIFPNGDVSYEFVNNHIVLKRKAAADNSKKAVTVTGKVRDSKGSLLPGVTVQVKGSDIATSTDAQASFSIQVPDGSSTLLFTNVGFAEQEVVLNGNNTVNVTLTETASALNEVVVIGYGSAKKSSLTGAVSSLKFEEVPKAAQPNLNSAIQGRIAGVNVVQNNAKPGGSFQYILRGQASVRSNNNPLFVIDGFPVNNPSDVDIVNPNDIESIEVLKDASSASIYGARASNGVILITTKKGKAGTTTVNVRSNVSTQRIFRPIEMLGAKELMQSVNRYYYEDWLYQNRKDIYSTVGPPPANAVPLRIEFTDQQIADAQDLTDWMGGVTRNGMVVDNNVSIIGGERKVKYLISFSTFNQRGVIVTSNYAKYSGRANLSVDISGKLTTGINVAGTQTKEDNTALPSSTDFAGILRDAYAYPTFLPVYDNQGAYLINPKHPQYPNPFSWKEVTDKTYGGRLLASNYWDLKLFRDLSFRASAGINIYNSRDESQYPKSFLLGQAANTKAGIGQYEQNQYLFDFTGTYSRQLFRNHSVKLLGGYAFQQFDSKYFYAGASDFLSDNFGLNALQSGTSTTRDVNSKRTTERFVSFFGRLNYDINNRYFITATLRADGSDKFGTNNQYGYFPSVAAAWRISEERYFKKNVPFVSNLKLRASYGQTGNASIGANSAYAYLAPNANYVFNNTLTTGVRAAQLGNPNLKWETTTEANIGLDFGFFKERISGSLELYKRNITDLLDLRPLGYVYPVSSVYDNVGETQSKGIELLINSINISKGDFKWTTTYTFTSFNDRWVNRSDFSLKTLPVYNTNTDPLHRSWGYKSDGLIKPGEVVAYMPGAPAGSIKFLDLNGYLKDANGNLVLDKFGRKQLTPGPDGKLDDADKVIISKSVPDFTMGLGNTFTYKNLSLSFFLYGEYGRTRINNTVASGIAADKFKFGDNVSVLARDIFRSDNQSGKYPSGLYTAFGNGDFFSQRCDFIRLKNLNLSYSLPTGLLNKWNAFKGLRVFVEGQNLLTLTKYTAGDPETDSYLAYFNQRTFTTGIDIRF